MKSLPPQPPIPPAAAPSAGIASRLDALAEAVRLRILRVLERQELSVGEIAAVMTLPQATVSRHLKIHTETAWLQRRALGTATLYRLILDDLPEQSRRLWTTVRDQMDDPRQQREDLSRLDAVLAERRDDSLGYFGRVAGEWDKIRSVLFGAAFTPPALLALLSADWVVADIGCGTGNAAEQLAPHVRRVIAVEPSQPMLDAAGKRLGEFENVELRLGGVERLPIEDQSIDAAVMVLVLHYVEDPAAALREVRRVTRPGGVCLLVDIVEHDRQDFKRAMGHRRSGFAERETLDLLADAGFTDARWRALPPSPGSRGPGLFVATARRKARG